MTCERGKHDYGLGEGVAPFEAIFLDKAVDVPCKKCGEVLHLDPEPGAAW